MEQTTSGINGRLADETAIHNIAKSLETAWNAGDGYAFAEPFADDVDYTVWNGLYAQGKQVVAEQHQHIFDTMYI